MSNHRPLNRIDFQNGLDVSSPALSPESQATLSDGSWNSIVSGSGLTRPWSGATSQGADTGSAKMLPFGDTWGGIKSISYTDKTFSTSDSSGNTVTISGHNYNTGLSCTLSNSGGTPALPTGLAVSTTYYIIRASATQIKFATSLANALLGTAIVITGSTGSGTTTVDVTTTSIGASGSFFQDIGRSRWGIGSGIPHIAGENVAGFTLSTNLQLQVASSGSYSTPVEAGLGQPSAPELGIIDGSVGDISASISAKIERTRPSTGARSLASPSSAVVVPQANKVRVTFPAASTGQTHWRVYFTFHGFGGTGVYYLGSYLDLQDIPETMVAAGTVGGSAAVATGTLTVGTVVDGSFITINGVVIYFRAVAPAANEVQIGATAADTATNLANFLTASLNPLLSVATYVPASTVITVTYGSAGTTGNSFALGADNANITRSGSVLTGGAAGDITRSLEFNYKDGDLLPIEASYDDYPPPAATHALRIQNVLCLAGCYSDSTSDPTSSSTGTAIAVSKENNYESYVPTSLLFLPEPVVDCLARPIDDYGYVACQNSIHAIQYIGDRGDGLPSCTLTTILPDIGVQYSKNWCSFRGRLLVYAGAGHLLMMDEAGNWNTDFAKPVAKILRGWGTSKTVVGYDPKNDSLVIMYQDASSTTHVLVYSLQLEQWRQIWLPDFGITGSPLSCVTAQRTLYFSLSASSINTAYTYDTGSATAPLTFCCNYQGSNGAEVQDIYELAVAAQATANTAVAVAINRNMTKTVFRRISCTSSSAVLTDTDGTFTSDMKGKEFILFGTDVGGSGTVLLEGTILNVASIPNTVTMSASAGATLSDCILFVGSFAAVVPNFGGETVKTFAAGDIATPTITIASHGFRDQAKVVLAAVSGGTLPTNITAGTVYYVKYSTANAFKLAASPGGTDIVLSGASGSMLIAQKGAVHLPNFQPHLAETRSHQVAVWMKATGDVGNVLSADVSGIAYSSRRAL